jgi:ComF family protein
MRAGIGSQVWSGIVSLVFPVRTTCWGCGGELAAQEPLFCLVCRQGFAAGLAGWDLTDDLIARAWAVGPYQGGLRRAVLAYKYSGKEYLAEPLGRLLAARLAGAVPGSCQVIPVPLHRTRRRQRGFNQAEALAQVLGKELRLPVRADILVRRQATRPLSTLNHDNRHQELRGAFHVAWPGLPGTPVLLVDDVVTSGATVHECAGVLRAAGYGPVYVATVCAVTVNCQRA